MMASSTANKKPGTPKKAPATPPPAGKLSKPTAVGAPGGGEDPDKPSKKPTPASKPNTPAKETHRKRKFYGSFADLPEDEPAPRHVPYEDQAPAFARTPPPHLTDAQRQTYDREYERLRTTFDPNPDYQAHARHELRHLWYLARDEWRRLGEPAVDFSHNGWERTANENNPRKITPKKKVAPEATGSATESTPTKGTASEGIQAPGHRSQPEGDDDAEEETDSELEEDMEASQILQPRRRGKKGDME